MKNLAKAAILVAASTTPVQAQEPSKIGQLGMVLSQHCQEVGNNTKAQCDEVLYKYGYIAGQYARGQCELAERDFNSKKECTDHYVMESLTENAPKIKEEIEGALGDSI